MENYNNDMETEVIECNKIMGQHKVRLKVHADNIKTQEDAKIFKQVLNKVESMTHPTLDWFFSINQENTHGGYATYGRGGNHVWVSRKKDGKRILMVTE